MSGNDLLQTSNFLEGLSLPETVRDQIARRPPAPGPLVKICGLSTPATVGAALDAGADLVGFVFFEPSPRNLSPDQAAALSALAAARAIRVALSVDADDDLLDAIVRHATPDMLQLHGRETPERVAEVRQRYGLPVMKAIGVSRPEDLAKVDPYRGVADRILFDAKTRADAILPGGNGLAFDWTLLEGLSATLPYMLSGGLEPGNVADAMAATGASALDVSSGVESAPGVKDPVRIAAFLRHVRGAASGIETLGSGAGTV